MYKISFTRNSRKDLKKVDYGVQLFLHRKYFIVLKNSPAIGKKLNGKRFKDYLYLKLRFKKVEYRVVYRVENEKLVVVIIMIGSRENFYKRLERRL